MNELFSLDFNPSLYIKDDYRTSLVGTSDCNMFIPVYSLFAHDLLVFENYKDLKILEYNLPGLPGEMQVDRQYARMKSHLKYGNGPRRYNFKLRGVDHYINMHRGILYKDDTILMCLGVNTEYIINTPMDIIRENIDTTKLLLFINNNFDDTVIYKNIRKKVGLMYIDELKAQGVDIVQTSRINQWLFLNNFKQPKFKSVQKMIKHLKEEVPMILLTE